MPLAYSYLDFRISYKVYPNRLPPTTSRQPRNRPREQRMMRIFLGLRKIYRPEIEPS
jgi:hypothetical protein